MSALQTALLSGGPEAAVERPAIVGQAEPEPEEPVEPERKPKSGSDTSVESDASSVAVQGAERPAGELRSTDETAGEAAEEDGVFLDTVVLRTIQLCISGPDWMTPFWWDVACTFGWLGACWTASHFYGVYIPGMEFSMGFASFVCVLPLTWLPICRKLRIHAAEGDAPGFITQQLQRKVSRAAARKVHHSFYTILAMQGLVCVACFFQNAAVGFGVTGLSPDVVLSLILFATGFPLGAIRFAGMLVAVVACAYSVSDQVQELDQRCARHHEVLKSAVPSDALSPSQLVETGSVLSAGRELGLLLATAHRYDHVYATATHF